MVLIRFVFKIIVGALGALLGLTGLVTILLALLEGDAQPIYLITIAIIFGAPTWICYWLYQKISAADLAAVKVATNRPTMQHSVTVSVDGRDIKQWEFGEYPQWFIRRWIERAETLTAFAKRYDIKADFCDDGSFHAVFSDTVKTLSDDIFNRLPDELDTSSDDYFEIVMQVEEYELNKFRPIYNYSASISIEVFSDTEQHINKTLIDETGETADIRIVQSLIKKYWAAKLKARKIISEYYADTKTDAQQDR